MLAKGEGDALICGLNGAYQGHLQDLIDVLGQVANQPLAALNVLVLRKGTFVVGDTHVHVDPNADTVASIALAAADRARRFGMTPKVALLSHSNFGSSDDHAAQKMRTALAMIRAAAPELEIDGEMQADAALLENVRNTAIGDSRLHGSANVLVMPSLDAANIAMHLLTVLGEGVTVGPILTGLNGVAHILPPSSSVRRVVNMSALAAVDAQRRG